jgi:hypothetical protein
MSLLSNLKAESSKMSSDTVFNSSVNSRPISDEEADAFLMNLLSEARRSRSPTPQSHKDMCPGPGQGHGQGGPVYSCGCYIYGERSKFELFTPRSRAFHRSVSTGNEPRKGRCTISKAKEVTIRLERCEYA